MKAFGILYEQNLKTRVILNKSFFFKSHFIIA